MTALSVSGFYVRGLVLSLVGGVLLLSAAVSTVIGCVLWVKARQDRRELRLAQAKPGDLLIAAVAYEDGTVVTHTSTVTDSAHEVTAPVDIDPAAEWLTEFGATVEAAFTAAGRKRTRP